MCFANWDGYVDVFMRVSTWEPDLWSHYKIEDQDLPENWHLTKAMTWISNDLWTMAQLNDRKRKRDTETISPEEEQEEEAEETISRNATVYFTAMQAMTPTRIDTNSPSPDTAGL